MAVPKQAQQARASKTQGPPEGKEKRVTPTILDNAPDGESGLVLFGLEWGVVQANTCASKHPVPRSEHLSKPLPSVRHGPNSHFRLALMLLLLLQCGKTSCSTKCWAKATLASCTSCTTRSRASPSPANQYPRGSS